MATPQYSSTKRLSPSRVAEVAERDRPLEVLLWHWGRAGAAAKFTYSLAHELASTGAVHTTVSAAMGSELAAFTRSDKGLELRMVRTFEGDKTSWIGKLKAATGLLGLWQLTCDFRDILRERQTDVAICTFQSIWDLAAIPILRRSKAPFILVLHDATFHPGDRYLFRQKVLRWEVECADALVVLSEHVGRAAHRLYDFPLDRIWTIRHGALSFGSNQVAPREFPRHRPMRLLFFGRIVKYKGLGCLLDAYRILRDRGLPVELDIVGSGDLGPYRSQLADLPDVSINNSWVDDEQIAASLARADIVVLPYVEASQSGVAAAAATAGLPVVATPVGGLVEQVREGQTGVIAKSTRTEDLAAAIQSLCDDATLYEICSAGALDHARGELGWAQIASDIAAIAKDIASRPRRRGRQ